MSAWVVTGAASGFGREVARRLALRGERVVLFDANGAGLLEVQAEVGEGAHVEVVDVRDGDAVMGAVKRARKAVGAIGHVFHAAGVLRVGGALEVPASDYRLMMEVNYLGTVNVARALVPEVRETARTTGKRGTLVLVASVAGLRGFPELAGYSASKFAVVGFAQALRDELAGQKIDVRVLCPPPGDTPMVRNLPRVPPVYKLSRLYSAEEVVDAALRALERPGFIVLVDRQSKLMWRLLRAAPGIVDVVIRRAARS